MPIWKGIKLTFTLLLIMALIFVNAFLGLLLYVKISGKPFFANSVDARETVMSTSSVQSNLVEGEPNVSKPVKAHFLSAPAIKQHPELPAGCEITSLTMLFQFYGINKDKMDLVSEMTLDPTNIVWGPNGTIKQWGHPNNGFVGDITSKSTAFGIYHKALYPLLKKYIPTGVDLTETPFDVLERQIAGGIPVVVWTTIDFQVPAKWVTWNTSLGPIRTTFMEHAVLMVGFDEKNVYVNDPWTGKSNVKIDKQQFIETWEAMGKQALSYRKD